MPKTFEATPFWHIENEQVASALVYEDRLKLPRVESEEETEGEVFPR